MVVNQRVCTLEEMCSMTAFLETGGLVRALDTLGVMAVDKVRDTETSRIFIQTPYPLHVMGINQIWGYFGLRYFAHISYIQKDANFQSNKIDALKQQNGLGRNCV